MTTDGAVATALAGCRKYKKDDSARHPAELQNAETPVLLPLPAPRAFPRQVSLSHRHHVAFPLSYHPLVLQDVQL